MGKYPWVTIQPACNFLSFACSVKRLWDRIWWRSSYSSLVWYCLTLRIKQGLMILLSIYYLPQGDICLDLPILKEGCNGDSLKNCPVLFWMPQASYINLDFKQWWCLIKRHHTSLRTGFFFWGGRLTWTIFWIFFLSFKEKYLRKCHRL